MTHRPIIDAGPGLNFLSINKERLLIAMLGRLSAPAAVEAEVVRKAAPGPAFPVGGKSLVQADTHVDRDPSRRSDA
jgi:hypothetical protein